MKNNVNNTKRNNQSFNNKSVNNSNNEKYNPNTNRSKKPFVINSNAVMNNNNYKGCVNNITKFNVDKIKDKIKSEEIKRIEKIIKRKFKNKEKERIYRNLPGNSSLKIRKS